MKKIMISVAPVAATDILINPRAIARDVYECYKNGASMVHLHCRDLNGNLTPDLSLLEETVAYIREMCDIVVEISTGGVSNLTIEERVQPCYPSWVEANSRCTRTPSRMWSTASRPSWTTRRSRRPRSLSWA